MVQAYHGHTELLACHTVPPPQLMHLRPSSCFSQKSLPFLLHPSLLTPHIECIKKCPVRLCHSSASSAFRQYSEKSQCSRPHCRPSSFSSLCLSHSTPAPVSSLVLGHAGYTHRAHQHWLAFSVHRTICPPPHPTQST